MDTANNLPEFRWLLEIFLKARIGGTDVPSLPLSYGYVNLVYAILVWLIRTHGSSFWRDKRGRLASESQCDKCWNSARQCEPLKRNTNVTRTINNQSYFCTNNGYAICGFGLCHNFRRLACHGCNHAVLVSPSRHCVALLTLWPWPLTFQSQNHVTSSISQVTYIHLLFCGSHKLDNNRHTN